jgi:DNA-binding MarR family transcriptional regulator
MSDTTTDDAVTSDRELHLLEEIERDPDVTQASLAAQLGVAVGTVNWLLKRFVDKGYVKVKRLQRRKLRYIITPEGIAFRARLTINYVETSLRLYRRVRHQVRQLLREVKNEGYSQVVIVDHARGGNGDLADICKLTCLEFNISPISISKDPIQEIFTEKPGMLLETPDEVFSDHLPVLEIRGTKVTLHMGHLDQKFTQPDHQNGGSIGKD